MRTVYAVSIGLSDPKDVPKSFDRLSTWIEGWYRRRGITFALPLMDTNGISTQEPASGHSFKLSIRSSNREPSTTLLEIDWSYPDDYDRGLSWNIKVGIALSKVAATITIQLGVTGTQFSIQPAKIKLGPPRIVKELTALASSNIVGYPYSSLAQVVHADSVDLLCESILDPKRPFPIVVVSHELTTERPLVDVDRLAAGLAGLMRVYELADRWAAYRVTEELGKPLSCYAGAVRIYWPGLALESDPVKHPAWMPWRLKQLPHTDALVANLFTIGAEASAYRFFEPPEIAGLRSEINEEERQSRRSESSNDAEQLLNLLIEAEDSLKSVQQQLAESQSENHTLRQNLDALLGAPSPSDDDIASQQIETDQTDELASVADAVVEAQRQCSNLVFLQSAEESAKSSPYRTPSRALQALQAIDEVAALWISGLNGGKSPGPLRNLFRQRGFEYKDDISLTSRGKWGAEYEAKYNGETIDISSHITIGAKQADTCLSIHMYWDKESQRVVIAHVGRHKTNTKT